MPLALIPEQRPETFVAADPPPATPAPSSAPVKGPVKRSERAEQIALFRYQLIRDAADDQLGAKARGVMVRALATQYHPWPFGGTKRFSRESIDRWIKAWKKDGFDGLKPTQRAQGPITEPRVLLLAETLKREKPHRTAAQIKRIIATTLGDAPSETTLLRHFRSLDISTGVPGASTGRFETEESNEIWVGDALHGPRIEGRKTYLFAFLDDHSRMVVASRWAFAEDTVRLAAVLRPALQTHGIPRQVYVDNGSAFADKALQRVTAKLGIRLVHSAPYRPQGRGKIERFFNTVSQQFLGEITVTNQPSLPGTGQGSEISTLQELNALFTSWVQVLYHRTIHSTTGQTPLERWDASWVKRTPVRKSPDQVSEAFLWSEKRKVTKTATISLLGNTYQVDPVLAGTRVELIYDPFDLAAPIAVHSHLGVPAGTATLLQIRRHVHPKAKNAAADRDAGAQNVSTGIDYLRLLEDQHKHTMSGAPISFEKLATPSRNTDTAKAHHRQENTP
ncbi:DDE-type integrase/transposase/recombinase [Paeniglutamicibacter sulfureus]|uniref:Transposase n=1 Tax=Paeniglutamicibacter sulfureus TaxID=43666 RepID=A0ABU2BG80_9MICC|nr:DDE-type integrase/transposase/recombinase [Paeniglutamicibacter sulfureus]MDR7356404.1 putative transposase [Paeniglutamicibacter sulfureus]